MKVRAKVCCISSPEEAALAIRCGASALGLVSHMPSGPGVISENLIAEIAGAVPPPIATFLLTSLQDVDQIIAQQRRCGTNTIQLCDRLNRGSISDLKAAMPGIAVVQVIHVGGEAAIDEAQSAAAGADALLLDSGKPHLKKKQLGGTGRVHNWEISRRVVEAVKIPVFLAGGLRAENVEEAVRRVRPFAVDICSGARTNGHLDERKLRNFFAALEKCDECPSFSL